MTLMAGLAWCSVMPAARAQQQPLGPARQPQRFALTYEARFSAPQVPPGEITIYIPVPSDSAAQDVESFSLESDLKGGRLLGWEIRREAEYGNRFVLARVADVTADSGLVLRYTVRRREVSNPLDQAAPAQKASPPDARFLQRDALVPLDGPVAQLARETVPAFADDDARIKAIYEKTVATMRYDKTGTGWGQGNVLFACDEKRGNCTDFHAMIIGMARVSKIPAKFEIGLPIPTDMDEGQISGYHCWAYLFHQQRGWVPLDASEGWKNNKKYKDYYLGRIGSDRIALSIGRDINVGQRGAPLNYFVFPYAEQGEGAVPMKAVVSFKKLSPGP